MDGKTNDRESDFLSCAKTIAICDKQQLGDICANGKQFPTHELAAIERQTGTKSVDGPTSWVSAAIAITLHEASAAVENFQCARRCGTEEK